MARIVFLIALIVCCLGMFVTDAFAIATLEISPIILKHNLDPGQQITKTLTAKNKGDSPLGVTMAVSDYTINDSGAPEFEDWKNNPGSAANWMRLDTKSFTLQPGELKTVKLTIDVPKSATAGGHYGAVLFQMGGPIKGTGKVSVGVVGRMAAVNLVTISGEISKRGSLAIGSIPFLSNAYPVPIELDYENKGNVHLNTQGSIIVRDWLGKKVKSIAIPESYVIPGAKKTLNVSMASGQLMGFYKTEFELKEKSIKAPAGPSYFIVFPWTLAAGIILMIAAIFMMGRRQGRKTSPSAPVAVDTENTQDAA